MIDFSNKTAIITGGTRGIGKSIADLLAQHGCYIIVTGTKSRHHLSYKNAQYFQLDLKNRTSIKIFLRNIVKLKSVDILINNAGINIIEPLHSLKLENWEKVLQVNLTGPLLLVRAISKMMREKKQGRIVNVGSVFGLVSREMRSSYSASKAGLIGLTKSVALDLAKENILVNVVCPGFTKTDMTFSILSADERRKLNKTIPLGRFAERDEIARAVLFLCSDWNTYITGQTIVVDGGYTIQ